MNEEEIKDIVKDLSNYMDGTDIPKHGVPDLYLALNSLLSMYQQEKEKNKKLEEEKEAFAKSYEQSRIDECDNYFLMSKVIDLMAEDLDNGIDFNNCVLDKGFTICNKEIDCVKCVKEYYFNKAKEKKDATKNIG